MPWIPCGPFRNIEEFVILGALKRMRPLAADQILTAIEITLLEIEGVADRALADLPVAGNADLADGRFVPWVDRHQNGSAAEVR